MEDSTPSFSDNPRPPLGRRLIGIIGGGVLLGLAGVVAGRALEPSRPALVKDLHGAPVQLDEQFGRIVRQRFPLGSPQAALTAELVREGFDRRDTRSFRWRNAHGSCSETATIIWQADANGRIVAIDPHYLFFCT